MRITTRWLQQSSLQNLRRSTAAMARASAEATSGKRITTASDDPLDAGRIIRLNAELRDISRYQRNGTWATTRMATEDAVLSHARDLLAQARKLATAAVSLPADDPIRTTAVTQIQQLREQIVSLGNTRIGDEYLFAGGNSNNPAFLANGTYAGDSTAQQTEIDAGVLLKTTDTGDVVFNDALAALDDMQQQLQTGTAADIQTSINSVADASTDILTVQTALGGRMSEISSVATRLATRASKTAEQRDSIQTVDSAEAAVNLSTAQTALQQAYSVISKILSVNLLDYLK
jgi:flagellar hook-associated protein 3 FlgL